MRTFLLAASFAALTFPTVTFPTLASAQTACERDQRNHQAAGTVIGAGVGALLGSAIAGNSSNTEGTIIGGVAGAAVGNQMGRGSAPCPPGYYDPRVVAAPMPPPPPAPVAGAYDGRYGTDSYYDERGAFSRDRFWAGAPASVEDRIGFLDARVDRAEATGAITQREADRAFDQIDMIRREARRLNRAAGGRLSYRDEAYLQRRLDDVSTQVQWARDGGRVYRR